MLTKMCIRDRYSINDCNPMACKVYLLILFSKNIFSTLNLFVLSNSCNLTFSRTNNIFNRLLTSSNNKITTYIYMIRVHNYTYCCSYQNITASKINRTLPPYHSLPYTLLSLIHI